VCGKPGKQAVYFHTHRTPRGVRACGSGNASPGMHPNASLNDPGGGPAPTFPKTGGLEFGLAGHPPPPGWGGGGGSSGAK